MNTEISLLKVLRQKIPRVTGVYYDNGQFSTDVHGSRFNSRLYDQAHSRWASIDVEEKEKWFHNGYVLSTADSGETLLVFPILLEFDALSAPKAWLGLSGLTLLDLTKEHRGLIEFAVQVLDSCRIETLKHFSVTPQMFCICGLDGNFISVNSAFAEALGYSVSEVEGLSYLELVHPEDLASTKQKLNELTIGNVIRNFRNRCLCKDGHYKLFEWASSISGDDGLIYAAVQDVTDRDLADKAVSESNDMLSAVSQALASFIKSDDSQSPFEVMLHHLLSISNSEYGFIGEVLYDEHDRPYLKSHALTNIAWDEATRELYAQSYADGLKFTNLETLFGQVLKTGELLISNTPSSDPRSGGLPPGHPPLNSFMGLPVRSGKALVGMIGIANRPGGYNVRIAEHLNLLVATCSNLILAFRAEKARHHIQDKLSRSEAAFRVLFDSAADGILELDEDGSIQRSNPAMEQIFGFNSKLLLGMSVSDLFHPDCHSSLATLLTKAKDRDHGVRGELTGHHRLLTEFPVEITVSTMAFGESTHFVAIVRDVSEWKALREELISAKAQADNANKAKGEFLANMSHEVRTPINGVIGMTELSLATKLDDEQKDYLETVYESAKSLLRVINDILDFSKIDAGKMTLDIALFDVREYLQRMLGDLALRARQKGIVFEYDFDKRIPRYVNGDAYRLRQILVNLISNAIKFTEHGVVKLIVSAIDGEDDWVKIRFSVRDTGIGITSEQKKDIFKAFSQGDASITRRYGGSGLGLVISSNLVNLMGGHIEMESEFGMGSLFYFDLKFDLSGNSSANLSQRVDESDQIAPEALINSSPDSRVADILIVEDNLINQKLTKEILVKAGHKVTVADNGLRALDLAKERLFDVILMDIQMPVMDGLEATRLIRLMERESGGHVPIIALTAHAMVGDHQRFIEGGMDAYISKPISSNALLKLVGELLS